MKTLSKANGQFQTNYMTQNKRGQTVRDLMPYGKVLLVDDVETNLYVAVDLMKLYRLRIDTTMSGQAAIDMIKSGNVYDVVFMDHLMPEMDGIEATKKLRGLGYTAPIVALTANAAAGQSDMFLSNGFDEFISKPIDIRQLDVILNKFVRDKQPAEVLEAARRQVGGSGDSDGSEDLPQLDSLLMDSFIRDAHKTVAALDELCRASGFEDEEDLRKYIVFVHGIKSSLLNINQPVLSETASKLEAGGRERDIDLIVKTTPGFIAKLRMLLETLESQRDAGASNSENDTGDLPEKLSAIQEMCEDYNRKGALDIIVGIKTCSGKTRAVLDIIKEHVLHSEFEEAESAAKAYVAVLAHAGGDAPEGSQTGLHSKEIPGLNIKRGLERYEGDEGIYLRILRSYAASVRSALDSIDNIDEDSLGNYKIRVHGIKGASLDIFAEQIGRDAAKLEEAANAGDFGFINEHHPIFLEAAQKLLGDINALFLAIKTENPKPEKDRPDSQSLKWLMDACMIYDLDDVETAMAEIEKYEYISDAGLSEWLRDNVDMMNFQQIVEKLSDKPND